MRSRLLFALASALPLASLALAGDAHADPVRTVSIAGQERPWLHVGAARLPQNAPLDAKARARLVVSSLAPEAAKLDLVATNVDTFGDGDRIVRFEQTFRGLPVIGRGATVRLDAAGRSVISATRLATDLPASIQPSLSADAAALAAQGFSPVPVVGRDAHLVIFPVSAESARLAYAIVPEVPTGFATAPRIVVDAENGKILEARDTVVFLNSARVYSSNPTRSGKFELLPLPIAPAVPGKDAKLENAFITSLNCVDQKEVKAVSFSGFNLNVHVCSLVQTAKGDDNGDFVYDPIDDIAKDPASRSDTFSEVMMYYHATRIYSRFRELQGSADAQVVVDKPFRTISNLMVADGFQGFDIAKMGNKDLPLAPFQNAFFSPAGGGLGQIFEQVYGFQGGAMWFGQGPARDYSYDGDVVYHELTHGVVDKTLQLGGPHADKRGVFNSNGAMNEALADYFAATLTGDPKMGTYAAKDISAAVPYIRTLDNGDTCAKSIGGEVHFDSTVWSGALWKARQSLPEASRIGFDKAIYKAMRTNAGKGDLGYEDLTNMFLETMKTDLPAGVTALTGEMTARGLLPSCERIFDVSDGKPLNPPAELGGARGTWPAHGSANLPRVSADVIPGMLQAKADLPAGNRKVTVTLSLPAAQQQGGGNPFGGGGAVFNPILLVKYNGPISWTAALKGDQDVTLKDKQLTIEGTTARKVTAVFEVPEGTKSVYVQVGNGGEDEGTYSQLTVTSEPIETATTGPSDPGANPPADAGTTSTTSCSCSVPGSSNSGPAAAGGFAALALAAAFAIRRKKIKSGASGQ